MISGEIQSLKAWSVAYLEQWSQEGFTESKLDTFGKNSRCGIKYGWLVRRSQLELWNYEVEALIAAALFC